MFAFLSKSKIGRYKIASFSGIRPTHVRCKNTVGFIGLGNMGSRMAQNLYNKGEKLVIYDTQSTSLKKFLSKNKETTVASNLKELAVNSSHIITVLPDSNSAWAVYNGEDGIFKNMGASNNKDNLIITTGSFICRNSSRDDTIFIDSSTGDPAVAQKLWKIAKNSNKLFLDAPVSGGVIGAEAGTLTFMVGGCETITENTESILLKMGSRIISCGSSGMGLVAKLCNNLLLGVSMAAVAETMNLGIRCGLDAKVLANVINSSSGRCWSSEIYNPVPGVLDDTPSSRNYEGGFITNLLLKDMKLGLNTAQNCNTQLHMAAKALQLYTEAVDTGKAGDRDFSIIYQVMKDKFIE